MTAPLLDVEDLRVSFQTQAGILVALDGVSFSVGTGEVVAIVGESGAGKSVTALTLMGLTRSANAAHTGRVNFAGTELLGATQEQLRRVRGAGIAMVFQDPMSSLNPVYRVGTQIAEQIRAHDRDISKRAAMARAVELLERVGVPSAAERSRFYPHEFSGGMRQRVMIAMALSCSPRLLIADEPTTALDVTIAAQILAQLRRLRDETGAALILITHDLGVVAEIADRVIVMYGGRVVEQGSLEEVFYDPRHPYTWGLLGSIARIDGPRRERLATIPGAPPSLIHPPGGCHFEPRCPHAFERCGQPPPLAQRSRCWLSEEQKRDLRRVNGQIGLAPRPGAAA